MELHSYHNTNNLQGELLFRAEVNAMAQEGKVLEFFRQNKGIHFSADSVHRLLFSEGTPNTSIRRAVSNLYRMGWLKKTDKMRMGYYGTQVHTYKFREQ